MYKETRLTKLWIPDWIEYLQENIYTWVPKPITLSAGEAGRHVVGFSDYFIDILLEVQTKKV